MSQLQAGSFELPAAPPAPRSRVAGFRTKLLLAMMLLVVAVTALALYFAQRSLTANVEGDLEREFQARFAALQRTQEVRHAALVERCRALARRVRIHAALEDGGLDLLYENADDELRDITTRAGAAAPQPGLAPLQAQFYRFLSRDGRIISPDKARAEGRLTPGEEQQLTLPAAPEKPQLGYLVRPGGERPEMLAEVLAMPIVSHATDELIGGLALGFNHFEPSARDASEMRSGIWVGGRLHSRSLSAPPGSALAAEIAALIPADATPQSARVNIDGTPHLVFAKRLNPDSQFPPAHEVGAFPLAALRDRQRQLTWRVVGAGGLLLLLGLAASHFASARLSAPVEKLAVDSERSARFSADASHQLKTPVTVLRAGLEELLTRDNLTPEECDQLSALIHQTYRLSTLIDDLLLLSRMDAGRLQLELSAVNLTHLIEASLDDLSAIPDELGVEVRTEFPPDLLILGEKRYTAIILQNLLENARKYNRRGGLIKIAAHAEGEDVTLAIANTGPPISGVGRAHIFERFHRGAIGENVPGYGLGLNLARELARLHGGDLRLVRSDEDGTEFEVRFRRAEVAR